MIVLNGERGEEKRRDAPVIIGDRFQLYSCSCFASECLSMLIVLGFEKKVERIFRCFRIVGVDFVSTGGKCRRGIQSIPRFVLLTSIGRRRVEGRLLHALMIGKGLVILQSRIRIRIAMVHGAMDGVCHHWRSGPGSEMVCSLLLLVVVDLLSSFASRSLLTLPDDDRHSFPHSIERSREETGGRVR